MKSLGQHFLKNRGAATKIIAALDVQAGETIFEVGPGHGELTLALCAACEKVGATVIAIEKDENLRTKLSNLQIKNLQVVHGDALKLLPQLVAESRDPETSYKIVGNIPYYITGHLLRVIGDLPTKPIRSIIMIQKEVAERVCSVPPKMNRLAASIQFWATPKIIARAPREDFSPMPEVDSAVISLETSLPQASPASAAQYYAAIHALFAQPRKTILNNLAASSSVLGDNKEKITKLLTSIGVDPNARTQNLTVGQIIAISVSF